MNIIMKKTDETDAKKIISDSSSCAFYPGLIQKMVKENGFPKNIVIDSDTGNYMFIMEDFVRKDNMNCSFVLFYFGKFYEFSLRNMFSDDIDFTGLIDDSDFSKIKEFIRLAFASYGRYGAGHLNSDGQPEFLVSPIFKGE